MRKELLAKLSLKLKSNKDNWMECFRSNVQMYVDEKEIRLVDIANASGIPAKTLDNFLHGKTKDCNLSTAVGIARALNVTIDELVGAETIDIETRECVSLARNLKDHHRYVIRQYVRHQYKMHGDVPAKSKQITIKYPECHNGHLKRTNNEDKMLIDHLQQSTRSRVCMGIQIPCEHYEPHFYKGEIILLGADRDGFNNEKCVISYGGNYYVCIKKIDIVNGEKKVSYISLMDGKNKMFTREEIDDKIGYVVGFLYPDGTWGER